VYSISTRLQIIIDPSSFIQTFIFDVIWQHTTLLGNHCM